MARDLTVVHALAPARVGGLESVVASLAQGTAGRGHRVHVAAVVEPGVGEHEFVAGLARRGVPVERVEVPHRRYHREVGRLREVFDRISPDVVHTHGYRGDVVAGTVARWSGLPVVSTVHGFTGGGGKNRFYEWVQELVLRRRDAVVAVSAPIRRRLVSRGVEADRVHLVRNAWSRDGRLLGREEARERLGLPRDAFVAGWVGRLSREKGPDVFLEAMRHVAGVAPDARASVVGEGTDRERLESRAQETGLDGRVRFHGRVPGAAELSRAFDVFVLSSRTEGTPVSLLEAVDAEVPVVATRVGGVPDVVRNEREALLVPPEDPVAIAEAVARVRRDREAAGERARRARQRLETEFDTCQWLDDYEEIYRTVRSRS
ncbi:MAG: glycosyltransferase [Gemmatimonadota bacterium]